MGSGPPSRPPRWSDLDTRTDAGGPGGGLLGLPGSIAGRNGPAQPPTHHDVRTDLGHPGAGAPPPKATRHDLAPPGRLPPKSKCPRRRNSLAAPRGVALRPRQPMGIGRAAAERQRQRRRAPDRRRERPVQGRLEDVQKVLTGKIGHIGKIRQSRPVTRMLTRYPTRVAYTRSAGPVCIGALLDRASIFRRDVAVAVNKFPIAVFAAVDVGDAYLPRGDPAAVD
jgi:hypothetical protein